MKQVIIKGPKGYNQVFELDIFFALPDKVYHKRKHKKPIPVPILAPIPAPVPIPEKPHIPDGHELLKLNQMHDICLLIHLIKLTKENK